MSLLTHRLSCPAEAFHIYGKKGDIKVGFDADV